MRDAGSVIVLMLACIIYILKPLDGCDLNSIFESRLVIFRQFECSEELDGFWGI